MYKRQALYQAKACGKKQYQIYDQSMEDKAFGQGAGRKATVNTTIESEQNGDMMLNDLLPRAFNILSKSEQMDKAVESVLELLGERLQVSRAYVFENSEDGTCYSNTFEWCARGIRSQKDLLQGCSYAEFSTDSVSYTHLDVYKRQKTGPDGRYMIDQAEAAIVRRIFEEYAEGERAKDIYERLNSEGYLSLIHI